MLILQNISYTHPNKKVLFDHLNLTVHKQEKIALIGNNGNGKSTLLRIIANELQPSSGQLIVDSEPYFVPQIFGQYNQLSIAQALGIERKIKALNAILTGDISDENFELLNDDWTIEERCSETLNYWQLDDHDLSTKLASLSGGQKTKVFLAGISIHQPELILLDEPSNHLDIQNIEISTSAINEYQGTLIVVSHDDLFLEQVKIERTIQL